MRVCKRFYRTLHTNQLWRNFSITQNIQEFNSVRPGRSQQATIYRLHKMLCLAGRRLISVKAIDRRRSNLREVTHRIWCMDLSRLKTLYIEARGVACLSSHLPNMKSLQKATILEASRNREKLMLNLGSSNTRMDLPRSLKLLIVTATLDHQWLWWNVTGSLEEIKILGLCEHRTFIKPVQYIEREFPTLVGSANIHFKLYLMPFSMTLRSLHLHRCRIEERVPQAGLIPFSLSQLTNLRLFIAHDCLLACTWPKALEQLILYRCRVHWRFIEFWSDPDARLRNLKALLIDNGKLIPWNTGTHPFMNEYWAMLPMRPIPFAGPWFNLLPNTTQRHAWPGILKELLSLSDCHFHPHATSSASPTLREVLWSHGHSLTKLALRLADLKSSDITDIRMLCPNLTWLSLSGGSNCQVSCFDIKILVHGLRKLRHLSLSFPCYDHNNTRGTWNVYRERQEIRRICDQYRIYLKIRVQGLQDCYYPESTSLPTKLTARFVGWLDMPESAFQRQERERREFEDERIRVETLLRRGPPD